jgi:hypothetical protein
MPGRIADTRAVDRTIRLIMVVRSTLTLLVTRVFANDANDAFAFDDAAIAAKPFY